MREFLRKLQKNNHKGFTLAELLIVIAITGILASFGFVEVAKAQRKLKRTEMDNTAREIFVAAQNHLTSAETNGTWEKAYFTSSGDVNIKTNDTWQNKITYSLTDYETDSSSKVYNTAQNDIKTHAFYYVIYNKTNNPTNALTDSTSVLQQLLPYGSVDDSARQEGSYIIEFDAKTQSIYGVFYTDKGVITKDDIDGLNNLRGDANATAREQYSLTDSTNSKKKVTTVIGYYGGATAYKNEVNRLNTPIIQIFNDGVSKDDTSLTGKVTPNSDHALEVVITDTNYVAGKSLTNLTVTVKQISGTETVEAASFTLNSPSQIANAENTLSFEQLPTPPKGISQANMLKVISTKASETSGIEYHISLDDISGTNRHFSNLFTDLKPGSDISVEATISYAGQASVSAAGKNVNSLYDSLADVDSSNKSATSITGNYSANIRTARHLQNLSQDVSNYKGTVNKFAIISAKLVNDIDWKSYTDKITSDVTLSDGTKTAYNFQSIYNETLSYFDGNDTENNVNHVLHTFDVRPRAGVSGLFNTIDKAPISISNIDLEDFNVSGSYQMGSLIGYTSQNTIVTNVHVYNSSADTYGKADTTDTNNNLLKYGVKSVSNCAGGLIGWANNTQLQITKSSASVNVDAVTTRMSAGGLVGYIYNGTADISESYVGGKVIDNTSYGILSDSANVTGYYAGGFFGSLNTGSGINISNCYTTASSYGTMYAGGFVGYEIYNAKNIITLKNIVYSAGDVACASGGYYGLFAGAIKENLKAFTVASNSNVYILDGICDATKMIGTFSSSNYTGMSTKTTKQLAAMSTTSADINAVAYDKAELGVSYPYPITASMKHYGDWLVPDGTKKVSLTKNIIFPAGLTTDQKTDLLKQIVQNTSISFKDNDTGVTVSYAFNASGVTVKENENGYTLSIPASVNLNDRYTITEITDDDFAKSLYAYSTDYTYTTINKSGNNVSGKTKVGTGSTISGSNIMLTKSETVEIVFNNNYQKYGPGIVYFEKYTGGGSYLHGYYGSDEIGSRNGFQTSVTTKVEDDGYLFVVPNATYNTLDAKYRYAVENYLWLAFSSYSWQHDVATVQTYIDLGLVQDVTGSWSDSIGLSGNHVYRIMFDNSDPYGKFSDLWGKAKYSEISAGEWNGLLSVKTYDTYEFNPYYADSLSTGSNYSGDNTLRPLIRSASQLARMIKHKSCEFSIYDQGGLGVEQPVNIDMTGYSFDDTVDLRGVTYEGVAFPGTEDNPVYPSLTGLSDTLFGYVDGTIQNLSVQADYENQKIYSTGEYGMFINQNYGTINNVKFINLVAKNSTVYASSSSSCFGIIGKSSGAVFNDVTIENATWENMDVTAGYIGLFGLVDPNCKVNNLTITGTQFKDSSFVANYAGVLGSISGTWKGSFAVSDTIFNNLTANASDFGVVGYIGGSLYNTTLSNTTWENGTNVTATTAGVIGYVNGDISNVDILDTTFDNATVNATYFGGTAFIARNFSNINIDGMIWRNGTKITAANAGAIANVASNADLNTVSVTDVAWNDVTLGSGNYGLIGTIPEGTTELNDVTMQNVNWTNVKGTPTFIGLLANAAGGTIIDNNNVAPMKMDTITFTGMSVTTDHFGLFGKYDGSSNGLNISNVTWDTLNISAASDSWNYDFNTSDSSNSNSFTALIPNIASGKEFKQTYISSVTIKNIDTKATVSGIVGAIYTSGKLTTTTVKGIHVFNDLNTKHSITGQAFGLIGIQNGQVDQLNILKGETYGVTFENLNLNVKNWGIIGSNGGTISNSSFNNAVINNIDGTNTITELSANAPDHVAFGIVGENVGGSLSANAMNNCSVTSIKLPSELTTTPVYFGAIGFNNNGKIDNKNDTKIIDITNLTVNNISMNDTKYTNYGFVGVNKASTYSDCYISNLSVSSFTTDGYAIAYSNVYDQSYSVRKFANLNNITVTLSDQSSLAPVTMVHTNDGEMTNITVKAKSIAGALIKVDGSGTETSDKFATSN